MRSRLAKYAPRPWLVVASVLIVCTLLWIRHTYFPIYDATVLLSPTNAWTRFSVGDLAGVANSIPITEEMEMRTATRLAHTSGCIETLVVALRGLEATPELLTTLEATDPHASLGRFRASSPASIRDWDDLVGVSKARMDQETIRRIEAQTGLPASVWADFLSLESKIEKYHIDRGSFDVKESRNVYGWLKRVKAVPITSGTVSLSVRDRDPHRAEVVADAIAVVAKMEVDQGINALVTRTTRDNRVRERRLGEVLQRLQEQYNKEKPSQVGQPSPLLAWSLSTSRDQLQVLSDRIFQSAVALEALYSGAVVITSWAGDSRSVPERREVPAYRLPPFRSVSQGVLYGIILLGASYLLAVAFHVAGMTARSLKASRSPRPASPAREMVAARDEDF